MQEGLEGNLGTAALARIEANKGNMGGMANGWVITKDLGVYGTNYMKRAVVAAFGWPANLSHDAVYPYTEVDSGPVRSSSARTATRYLRQGPDTAGQRLLVDHDVRDRQGWWFVPNPLNKFTVSMRDNPKFNPDGSFTLYFQNESPGKDLERTGCRLPRATSFR